ncbi:hypothetical protein BCR42DRAFT_423100 [Absidia repens]|uniref:Uncharacterized protein n=1 Tax=Absidia repens TaxID=90262 RepID=A0A1X2I6X5_9FUNG|nr:hypothetical protein BCR42DRAFT_423100 [Absidia repens]
MPPSIKLEVNHPTSEPDDYTSPPPSPPPIHTLYTDGSIYRGTYSSPLAAHLHTRNNKAGPGYEKPPPFLVPKPAPSDQNDDNNNNSSSSSKKRSPRQQQMYGYMRKLTIYLMKQLVKKNNLALVINLVHQGWRARFFVARTIQHTQQALTTYPFHRDYVYYRNAAMQAGKLLLLLAKKEQRLLVNEQLSTVDIRTVMGLYMTVIFTRMTAIARLGFKTGMGALKHLGAWDSLMMAFTSVALTRSLQNPSHWM